MTSRMILFFCLSVIAFQARADWVISPTVAPDSEYKERTTALDEQEPDTLFYDDSGPNFSIGSIANYYAYVRFTPPADFQLRSIYVGVGDTAGTAVPCSLWVHLPNGSRPGIELAAVEIELQAGHTIYDITLDEPLDFSGGQDFMVVIGRSPGRTGWSPLLDGGSTVNRSYVTLENRTMGFYQAIPYDFRIRAGGSFNMYVDASAEECFNQVNHGASAYHVRAGDSVLFKTRIANLGDVPISSCELHWIVYDGMDNEIWSNTIELFDLDPDSQRTAAAASAFVPAEAGDYLCLCRIRADEDADSANNTALLRMFAAQNPAWYHYDDMEADGAVVHGPNWSIGVSFRPATATSRIESLRVHCATPGQADLRIYANRENGIPMLIPQWSETRFFDVGWTTAAVDPPLTITDSASFTAAFVFNGNIALSSDYDPPNASASPSMGGVAWLRGPTDWQADYSGNWMIHAFVSSEESTAPDYPSNAVGSFILAQNFPNPFNPTTTISFELPASMNVELAVFDLAGRRLATILQGIQSRGSHSVLWNGIDERGASAATGVYLYRIMADDRMEAKKMILIR